MVLLTGNGEFLEVLHEDLQTDRVGEDFLPTAGLAVVGDGGVEHRQQETRLTASSITHDEPWQWKAVFQDQLACQRP